MVRERKIAYLARRCVRETVRVFEQAARENPYASFVWRDLLDLYRLMKDVKSCRRAEAKILALDRNLI